MTLIHLMRHGETEWNALRRLQGQADIALSDVGRAQVRAQRTAFEGLTVHAITSDLARAVQALVEHAGTAEKARARSCADLPWQRHSRHTGRLSGPFAGAFCRRRTGQPVHDQTGRTAHACRPQSSICQTVRPGNDALNDIARASVRQCRHGAPIPHAEPLNGADCFAQCASRTDRNATLPSSICAMAWQTHCRKT